MKTNEYDFLGQQFTVDKPSGNGYSEQMTLRPWERTLGKVTLQPGVVPPPSLLLTSLSSYLFIFISAYSPSPSLFFLGGGGGVGGGEITGHLSLPASLFSSSYPSSNLYLTDSILLYPARIFFHLSRSDSRPPSIARSPDAQKSASWLREREVEIWKGERDTRLCQRPTGLLLLFQ